MKNKKNRGLGRGLSSLIPDDIEKEIIFDDKKENRVNEIEVDKIKANALQPRRNFNNEDLENLSISIKRNGVIQPIVLRKIDDYYEIIAGERRWRASIMAKLKTIPAIVMDLDEEQRYEVSLIENLQRTDLNPIEEAMAYKTLVEKYNFTQEKVAEIVGKSRSNVTNTMRLLKLSKSVQDDLVENKITVGHAKMLVTLSDKKQKEMSEKIQNSNINVRELENLLKPKQNKENKAKKINESKYDDVIDELSEKFGTKVEIVSKKEKGKIVFEFYNQEDFNRIYKLMKK